MTIRCVYSALLAMSVVVFAVPQQADAALVAAFEFNTPGDDEEWQHNGANGGSSDTTGPTAVTAGSGEGVLTAQTVPGNGDTRVLYNPDLSLPAGFTNWTTIDLRFRQLDGLNGNPQDILDSLGSLHFGIEPGSDYDSDGTIFVEESPGDTEYWYTASLDISGFGNAVIEQIRIDPMANEAYSYQIDWVRVHGEEIPEPTTFALLSLGLVCFMRRRASSSL